jgi:hypothetical protein
MPFKHHYHHARGPSLGDFYVLGYRYDDRWDFSEETGESFVLQRHEGRFHVLHQQRGYLSSLWRTPSGGVMVAYHLGGIAHKAERGPRRDLWRFTPLDAVLQGVWGFAEDCVFAWGHNGPRGDWLHRFDGHVWSAVPSPGPILAMHGSAPDVVFAVGLGGFIARWDGSRWSLMASPTDVPLSDVFVESPERAFAVGPSGVVLEGSVYGWTRVVERTSMQNCVARLDGTTWIGSTMEGLARLERDRLVTVDAEIKASLLDARGALLVTTAARIVEMKGEAVVGEVGLTELVHAIEEHPPSWLGKRPLGPEDDPDAAPEPT